MRRWAGLGMVTVMALGALRQSARVRRAFAEAQPPRLTPLPSPAPSVSIIVPMRNEGAHVDGVLSALLAQDYPAFDVTVIDDGSTDATPALLAAWAARDPRLRVHRLDELPAGWAGKAHALHTGVGLSQGEWLLFTDADTRHAAATLRLMLGHALHQQDDLLSLLPEVRLTGPATRLLTPIGALTVLNRATPAEVRDPRHRHAVAIGQYLLLRRAAYMATGGYATPRLRATFADDVALAEQFKRLGQRLDLVDGRGLVTNEQWTTWRSAWQGWRKSAYGEVAPQPLWGLAGGLLLLAYGLLPLAVLWQALRVPGPWRGKGAAAVVAATTVVAQIDARRHIDRACEVPVGWSLSAPLGWAALGVLLDTTWCAVRERGALWKGRPAPRPNEGATGHRKRLR